MPPLFVRWIHRLKRAHRGANEDGAALPAADPPEHDRPTLVLPTLRRKKPPRLEVMAGRRVRYTSPSNLLRLEPASRDPTVAVHTACPTAGSEDYYIPDAIVARDYPCYPSNRISRPFRADLSEYLEHMREPSLSDRGHDSLRFSYVDNTHPITVRVDWMASGEVLCSATECLMSYVHLVPRYGPPRRCHERRLSEEEVDGLSRVMARERFWEMDPPPGRRYSDGGAWILEGRRDNRYRIVATYAPYRGPVFQLGHALASCVGWTRLLVG